MKDLSTEYFITVEYFCYILAVTIFLISVLSSIKPIYDYFAGIKPRQEIIIDYKDKRLTPMKGAVLQDLTWPGKTM